MTIVATGEAYIRLMSGDDRGKGWQLDPAETYILGRSRKSGIYIPDPTISASHAKLECRGETWFLIDLGSTHGSHLNRQKILGPEALFDRDLVWVGRTVLEFRQYEQLCAEDLAEVDRGVQLPETGATG